MIDQTNGLGSALVAEQFLRLNGAGNTDESRQDNRTQEEPAAQQGQAADTVSLSTEAVTLATTVQPAAQTPEVSEPPPVDQGEEIFTEQQVQRTEEQRPGSIDIRV